MRGGFVLESLSGAQNCGQCFTFEAQICSLRGSVSLLVMTSGLKPDEKRGDRNREGWMRKRAPMPGKDWIESLSASPKARQNHFVGHLPRFSFATPDQNRPACQANFSFSALFPFPLLPFCLAIQFTFVSEDIA